MSRRRGRQGGAHQSDALARIKCSVCGVDLGPSCGIWSKGICDACGRKKLGAMLKEFEEKGTITLDDGTVLKEAKQ